MEEDCNITIGALGTTQAMMVSELVKVGSKLVDGLEACHTQCPYRLYHPQDPTMWYEQCPRLALWYNVWPPCILNPMAHPWLYPQSRLPAADPQMQPPHSLKDLHLLRNEGGDSVIAFVTLAEMPGDVSISGGCYGDGGEVGSDGGVVNCGEVTLVFDVSEGSDSSLV
nr:hypothetical protein [Tanacetum cinerariifolium]